LLFSSPPHLPSAFPLIHTTPNTEPFTIPDRLLLTFTLHRALRTNLFSLPSFRLITLRKKQIHILTFTRSKLAPFTRNFRNLRRHHYPYNIQAYTNRIVLFFVATQKIFPQKNHSNQAKQFPRPFSQHRSHNNSHTPHKSCHKATKPTPAPSPPDETVLLEIPHPKTWNHTKNNDMSHHYQA
jgi:hypothetical protein